MDIRRRNLMGQVSITANVTIENVKGSWGESSKTVSGYRVYESKGSYNVNNGYDLAKVTFSGYPEFTFLYGSYAESSYDFVVISPLDYVNAQNWTNSSYSGSLLSTSGKQSSSAPNLSYTFTNDGGEHFFYILYRKDSSVNSGADRGYIAFRLSNYLEVSNLQISVNHSSQSAICNITSDMEWSVATSADWITVDKTSGYGNNSLNINVPFNEVNTLRTGTVSVSSAQHTRVINITQAAYDISVPSNLVATSAGTTISLRAELGLEVTNDCEWLLCDIVENNGVYTLTFTVVTELTENISTEVILRSNGITKTITIAYSLFRGIILEFTNTSNLSEFFIEHNGGVGDSYKIGEDGQEVALSNYTSFTDTYKKFSFSQLSGKNFYINTPGTLPVSDSVGWSTYKGIKRRSGGLKVINLQNVAPYSFFYLLGTQDYPLLETILFPTVFNGTYVSLWINSTKENILISNQSLCILSVGHVTSYLNFEEGVFHNMVLYVNSEASKSFILEKAPLTDNGCVAIRSNISLSESEKLILIDKGWTVLNHAFSVDKDVVLYNYFN